MGKGSGACQDRPAMIFFQRLLPGNKRAKKKDTHEEWRQNDFAAAIDNPLTVFRDDGTKCQVLNFLLFDWEDPVPEIASFCRCDTDTAEKMIQEILNDGLAKPVTINDPEGVYQSYRFTSKGDAFYEAMHMEAHYLEHRRHALKKVKEFETLPQSTQAVFSYVTEAEGIHPSQKFIRQALGLSAEEVRTAINELQSLGLIERHPGNAKATPPHGVYYSTQANAGRFVAGHYRYLAKYATSVPATNYDSSATVSDLTFAEVPTVDWNSILDTDSKENGHG